MNPTIKVDHEGDAAVIVLLDEPVAYGYDLDTDRRIDYTADHRPARVELLNVSLGVDTRNLPRQDVILGLLWEAKINTIY